MMTGMKQHLGVISSKIHLIACKSEKPITISHIMAKLKRDPRKVMIAVGWLYRSGLVDLEERNLRIYVKGKRCGRVLSKEG